MKKYLALLLASLMLLGCLAACSSEKSTTTPPAETAQDAPQTTVKEESTPADTAAEPVETADELEGEITFWHSFTQGPRLERIQAAADAFMTEHPKVKINIETYSWADFYTKWTTGLASGNVPDMSTAQAGQVVEMINADAIIPLDDMIDEIGRDRFYESPIQEMTYDGSCYAVPIYSHAFVMWYRKDLLEKYHGVTAEALVESALDKVKLIEDMGYDNLVISIKSSDVMMCVKAHELIAKQTDHPLHVGITESGTVTSGNIKSAIGLGLILNQGIGDTIRVSLTGDPTEEIKSAKIILRTLGLRKGGIEVVSCPTCGRTRIDLIGLANQVENMVADIPLDLKVAVMGCVVNGPGEAREADIGIAGGVGEGLIIKHGEIYKKVPEAELLSALREELLHWEQGKEK